MANVDVQILLERFTENWDALIASRKPQIKIGIQYFLSLFFTNHDVDVFVPHELWDDVVTRAGANLTPA